MKSCVYNNPTLTYNKINSSQQKDICKIVKHSDYFEKEINFFLKIRNEIDYRDYFYTFISFTPLKVGYLSNNSKFIEDIEPIETSHVEYLVKYTNEKHIILNDYLNLSTNKNVEIYKTIIQCYPKVLNILLKLQELQVIHTNVNLNTICIRVSNQKDFVLTNFSSSITDVEIVKQLLSNNALFNTYSPNKIWFPPEIHILSFLLSNKIESISEYNIDTILSSIFNEKNQKLIHKKYFNRYVNKNIEEIKRDIFKYWFTWDTYSYNFHLLQLLLRNKIFDNKIFLPFIEMLKNYLIQLPNNRVSTVELLNNFNDDFISKIDYDNLKRILK